MASDGRGSDDLSQALLGLAAWMSRISAGSHALTPEGAAAFEAALDKAALQAITLEYRLEMAYGRRPETPEVHDAIRAGKVAVLPTGLALTAVYAGFSDGREA